MYNLNGITNLKDYWNYCNIALTGSVCSNMLLFSAQFPNTEAIPLIPTLSPLIPTPMQCGKMVTLFRQNMHCSDISGHLF